MPDIGNLARIGDQKNEFTVLKRVGRVHIRTLCTINYSVILPDAQDPSGERRAGIIVHFAPGVAQIPTIANVAIACGPDGSSSCQLEQENSRDHERHRAKEGDQPKRAFTSCDLALGCPRCLSGASLDRGEVDDAVIRMMGRKDVLEAAVAGGSTPDALVRSVVRRWRTR